LESLSRVSVEQRGEWISEATEIRNEVKTLSPDQRGTPMAVFDFDLRGSDVDDDAEIEAAWNTEIIEWVDEMESGQVNLLRQAQFMSVFDEARAELRSRRVD
jgi:hypothetical protein